jgi:hypothetical protein
VCEDRRIILKCVTKIGCKVEELISVVQERNRMYPALSGWIKGRTFLDRINNRQILRRNGLHTVRKRRRNFYFLRITVSSLFMYPPPCSAEVKEIVEL